MSSLMLRIRVWMQVVQFSRILCSMNPISKIDSAGQPRLNSNGNLIHPSEVGIANFWRWFESSAVVHDDGVPLVVFHGSVVQDDGKRHFKVGDIEQFDRLFSTRFRAQSIDTVGSWFSSAPGETGASMYSGYP